MNEQTKQKVIEIIRDDKIMDIFFNLKMRWSCEKDCEDFNDYAKILKESLPKNVDFIKATKRPFGVQAKVDDVKVALFLKRKGDSEAFQAKIIK